MASRPAVRRAAQAIKEQDLEAADRLVRELELAEVRRVDPLQVVLLGRNVTLDDEDLAFSAWVRAYDHEVGIKPGDNLALKEDRGGDWVALDVVAKDDETLFGQGDAEDKHITIDVPVPASTWTLNHNLGKRPAIQLFDTADQKIGGAIEHVSENQARVYFNHANAGRAVCN